MLAIFLIFLLVVLYKSKFQVKGTSDYLNIENTTSVKGIFILIVFFSHFNGYVKLNGAFDDIYKSIFSIIGQAMVAMFMFYSGYGIMESAKKKGDSYVSQIPFKRILATLFRFDCAVILFLIIGLVLSEPMTVKQVLLSFIGWESIGNSNWYIFVILVLYLLAYISFKICKTKKLLISAFFMAAATVALMLVTVAFNIKPLYWYDTVLCFVVGMFYSLWKEHIVKIINHNIIIWSIVLIFSFGAFYISRRIGSVFHIPANIFFTIGFVVLTMRVTFNNKILNWCGKHLFEIYILQRIPMIILKEVGVAQFNIFVYFVLSLMVTVALAPVFKYLTDKFWNFISGFKVIKKAK